MYNNSNKMFDDLAILLTLFSEGLFTILILENMFITLLNANNTPVKHVQIFVKFVLTKFILL